jgi:cold shock protein
MGRGHDWRPPRRRGFDDDNFGAEPPRRSSPRFGAPMGRPAMDAQPGGPPTKAKVKWFNAEKGFGFVELGDGSGDAFLHLSVLQRAGQGPVQPGTSLLVRVSQGQKGAQVAEVLEVDASTASATPAPRERSFSGGGGGGSPRPARRERDVGATVEMRGTVKWYNAAKGFGFVVVPEGGKDVFVHVSVLEQEGLGSLAEGQAVVMQVAQGTKGPEAVSIKLG